MTAAPDVAKLEARSLDTLAPDRGAVSPSPSAQTDDTPRSRGQFDPYLQRRFEGVLRRLDDAVALTKNDSLSLAFRLGYAQSALEGSAEALRWAMEWQGTR